MKIKIYQIYFNEDQKQFLDPAFIPFDNSRPSSKGKFEVGVFLSQYSKLDFSDNTYFGFVSWKFNQKTKLSGADFINFAKANPGFDVYFINPFPELEVFSSVWEQGEIFHPGLLNLSNELLTRAKINSFELSASQNEENMAYCNYWVGNKQFWDQYVKTIQAVDDTITNLAPDSDLQKRLSDRADKVIKANFYPFIFERIFSTFIENFKEIRAAKYQYDVKTLFTKMNPLFVILLKSGSIGRIFLRKLISRRA